MSREIRTLLKDPDRARGMGQAGAPRVKAEFSHEATAKRLRGIMGV